MELVIDANIIISAVISSGGKTCDLLFSDSIELFAPEFLLKEFERYKLEILEKSRLTEEEFNLALSLISSRIKFIPFSEFEKSIFKARKLCPDPDDTEYFALAILKNIPLWSNDKALKKQESVKVLSTSELLELFS